MHIGDGFQQNILEKAYFITKMSGLAMVRSAQFRLLESVLRKTCLVHQSLKEFCKSEN